jgi:hypothetical protein
MVDHCCDSGPQCLNGVGQDTLTVTHSQSTSAATVTHASGAYCVCHRACVCASCGCVCCQIYAFSCAPPAAFCLCDQTHRGAPPEIAAPPAEQPSDHLLPHCQVMAGVCPHFPRCRCHCRQHCCLMRQCLQPCTTYSATDKHAQEMKNICLRRSTESYPAHLLVYHPHHKLAVDTGCPLRC